MPSRRTNKFPESGRGLGHVTPTIFGSTVGYPSDSLASCLMRMRYINPHLTLTFDIGTKYEGLHSVRLSHVYDLHKMGML